HPGPVRAPEPGGPPGQAPDAVTVTNSPATQNVAVTNFPATQNIAVTNEVDVNIVNSGRIQIRIVGESSSEGGAVTGVIERADGHGTFATVPVGMKLVLTDFIVSIGVPNDPVIGDNDDFLGNISRERSGGTCTGNSERRWEDPGFRRDQSVAQPAPGLGDYAREGGGLGTGAPSQAPHKGGGAVQGNGILGPPMAA